MQEDGAGNQAKEFLAKGKKFEKAWRKMDKSKNQSGMLDL